MKNEIQIKANDKKIDEWSDRAKDYYKHGQNKPNPIIMDENGDVQWLNRKERRAQMRRKNAKRNRVQRNAKKRQNGSVEAGLNNEAQVKEEEKEEKKD